MLLFRLFGLSAVLSADAVVAAPDNFVSIEFDTVDVKPPSDFVYSSNQYVHADIGGSGLVYQPPADTPPDQPYNLTLTFAGTFGCVRGIAFEDKVSLALTDLATGEVTSRLEQSSSSRTGFCFRGVNDGRAGVQAMRVEIFEGIPKLAGIHLGTEVLVPQGTTKDDIKLTQLKASDPAFTFSNAGSVTDGLSGILVKDGSVTFTVPTGAVAIVPRGSYSSTLERMVVSVEPQLPQGWGAVTSSAALADEFNIAQAWIEDYDAQLRMWTLDPTIQYTVKMDAPAGERGFSLTGLDVYYVDQLANSGTTNSGTTNSGTTNSSTTDSSTTNSPSINASTGDTPVTATGGATTAWPEASGGTLADKVDGSLDDKVDGTSDNKADGTSDDKADSNAGLAQSKSVPMGAVVGAVIGGVLLLIVLILIIWFCLRSRKRRREEEAYNEEKRMTIDPLFAPESTEMYAIPDAEHSRSGLFAPSITPAYGVVGLDAKRPIPHPHPVDSKALGPHWPAPSAGSSTSVYSSIASSSSVSSSYPPSDSTLTAHTAASTASAPQTIVRHDSDAGGLVPLEELLPPMYNPNWQGASAASPAAVGAPGSAAPTSEKSRLLH